MDGGKAAMIHAYTIMIENIIMYFLVYSIVTRDIDTEMRARDNGQML